MELQFISDKTLIYEKWNKIVSSKAEFYTLKEYLDTIPYFWGIVSTINFEKVAIVHYSKNFFGYQIAPALLSREQNYFGFSENEMHYVIRFLEQKFRFGTINSPFKIKQDDQLKYFQNVTKIYQYNTLAKRMLKKANSNALLIKNDEEIKQLCEHIFTALRPKVKELNVTTEKKLFEYFRLLEQRNSLIKLAIYKKGTLLGALFYFKNDHKITYLTGGMSEEGKADGGMYYAMDYVIQNLEENQYLDFGGSSIPNIKRFFNSLGGEDNIYFTHTWDKRTWIEKRIYNILKKVKNYLNF